MIFVQLKQGFSCDRVEYESTRWGYHLGAHLRDEVLKRASNLAGDIIQQAMSKGHSKKVANIDDYDK